MVPEKTYLVSADLLKGYGFSLPVSYLVWIAIVIALYPLCKRYDAYKQANKGKWWLSLSVMQGICSYGLAPKTINDKAMRMCTALSFYEYLVYLLQMVASLPTTAHRLFAFA